MSDAHKAALAAAKARAQAVSDAKKKALQHAKDVASGKAPIDIIKPKFTATNVILLGLAAYGAWWVYKNHFRR